MDTAAPFRLYVEDILDRLAEDPGREVVVHGERRVTAGEFRSLVHRAARALRELGLGPGRSVTLLAGNLPETLAARYAAHLSGCTVNHLYHKLSADAQAAIVADVETRALIADPRYAGRAAELTDNVPVEHVLTLGPAPLGTDLLALAAGQEDGPVASLARAGDICGIRHTGGTTGHPKGICHTFQQQSDLFGARKPDADAHEYRQLACTTLAHVAGLFADITLRGGGTVVLQDDFEAGAVLEAVEREGITHMFLLPPLLYQLLDHPASATTDLSSLRSLVYGGCAASPARLIDATRRLGPVLSQFYGQSEVGGISMLMPEDHDPARPELLRSAGRIVDGVEVAIRDEEGRDLPPGERGEICVRSRQAMQGYWKQPELTAKVLRDGWIHTGDVGYLDENGYLTVADRLKDMIIVVGGHVYTSELEDLLNSHPDVLQSAVFGVRDADRTEQVHAVVVPRPGAGVDEEALRTLVREARGAMYEPARISFAGSLPLTEAGKPDKNALRRAAEETAGVAA
ncbi:AMP-binding protein [Streptomyces mashuensis]|nr:AMP-binding protein [Streptomyces mashuensis]